ncbi:MAG: OB-fold-containig protein [Pseudomonadota bacterium]
MSSLAFLLSPQLMPFAGALGLVAALCLLEVVMAFIGMSLLGDAGADADFDADLDAEFDLDGVGDVDPDLGDLAADFAAEMDAGAEAPSASAGSAGLLSWLGVGQVPFMIWLAGTLTAFGIAGYGLQMAIAAVLGTPAPAVLAAAVAFVPGIVGGASVSRFLARLMPKTESSAISTRSYGGRRGVITTGTARRGMPAEARFRDGHGNTHYAMVEPMHDHEELQQGTEIAIIRHRDGQFRAIKFEDAAG